MLFLYILCYSVENGECIMNEDKVVLDPVSSEDFKK